MYQHLVVAVDGSATSVNALQHACSVAKAGNARLTLVHVANPAEYMALAPEFLQQESYEEAAVANGNEVLRAAAEQAVQQASRIFRFICWLPIKERVKWRRSW